MIEKRQDARFNLKMLSRDSLISLMGRTIRQCSIPVTHTLTETWMFCLELDQGEILKFSTYPICIGGWNELGCLTIEATTAEVVRSQLALPYQTWVLDDFILATAVALVYEDDAWCIESGIRLRSTDGREIIVVPGIPPGSVSVRLEGHDSDFAPELPMHEYRCRNIGVDTA